MRTFALGGRAGWHAAAVSDIEVRGALHARGSGTYRSEALDSRLPGCHWDRLRFDVALPADRTAVLGVSASGELALAMGLCHPGIYGVVFCASPSAGYRPPASMPSSLPRVYLVAGRQEPFFLENATRWTDALREHVRMSS